MESEQAMIDGDKEIEIRKYLVEGLGYPDDFAREFIMEMRYNRHLSDEAFRRAARSSWISEESREWAKARPEYKEEKVDLSSLSEDEIFSRYARLSEVRERTLKYNPNFDVSSLDEPMRRLIDELDRRTQP